MPGGASAPLTFANRALYVEKALACRLHECDAQARAVRDGLSWIVPLPLLSLQTAEHLERLVCGAPVISIAALRKVARYRDVEPTSDLIMWFWAVLEGFGRAERSLFMRFVSGRSRLPANPADISQRFQVMRVERPVNSLPTSQTCFFQLRLPPYSSQRALAEKLSYAIHNCRSIDTDNYMLTRNADVANALPFDEQF